MSINTKRYQKPTDEQLKNKLSPQAYDITQNGATERPFSGKFWDHQQPGIYVDIVTGEPLFISSNKFDAGCGWPSFSRPVNAQAVTEYTDLSLGMVRTEVRSQIGNSHLGHVFNDGPKDKGGLRYCINSAALRFIAYEDMEVQGYGEFKIQIISE